jgi:uncharacterized protein YegL
VQISISHTPYTAGLTNIASGMIMALETVFGKTGDRPSIPNVMIVITDGEDSSNVAAAQQEAARKHISVFAVGVGPDVNYEELLLVAGEKNRVYNTTSYAFLEEMLKYISCQLGK